MLPYLLIPLKCNVPFLQQYRYDCEITQKKKKQRPSPNPDDIKTTIFCRNEKVKIVQRSLFTTMLNK